MKKLAIWWVWIAAAGAAFSQGDEYGFSDESFELSPFTVSGQRSSYDGRGRGGEETTPPARLVVRADAALLKLTISSESSKPEERIADLQAAYAALRDAAAKERRVSLKTGYVALPLVKGRSYSLSMKTPDEVSSFEVTLVAKMGEADTVFERIGFLNSFVETVQLPRNVRSYFVASGIGLLDADKYRPELLRIVGAEYKGLIAIFGEDAAVTVHGLDQRVRVRALDEAQVEVALPYRLELRVGGVAK